MELDHRFPLSCHGCTTLLGLVFTHVIGYEIYKCKLYRDLVLGANYKRTTVTLIMKAAYNIGADSASNLELCILLRRRAFLGLACEGRFGFGVCLEEAVGWSIV